MTESKVTYAQLHDVIFVPGEGQFDKTLPPQNKTLPDFRMSREPNGDLLLEWTRAKRNARFIVPHATVKGALLEPNDDTPANLAAKAAPGPKPVKSSG